MKKHISLKLSFEQCIIAPFTILLHAMYIIRRRGIILILHILLSSFLSKTLSLSHKNAI